LPPKKNWKLLSVRLPDTIRLRRSYGASRHLSGFSRGDFLAAAGDEMRSNYFKNTAPILFAGTKRERVAEVNNGLNPEFFCLF